MTDSTPQTPEDEIISLRKSANLSKKAAHEFRQALTKAREDLAKAREEKQAAVAKLNDAPIRPVASPAKMKKRHYGMFVSFFIMVMAPIVLASFYLYTKAVDQYASTVGFTVRSEDVSSAADLLSGFGGALTGGSSSSADTDILYEFMRSQDLVRRVDNALDLRNIYARYTEIDPIFGFDTDGTIEDLTDYWQRMVRVSYDAGAGLMELRVLAFDPDEAQSIAKTIFTESSLMINALSDIARNDATRYAKEDLDNAVERLKSARESLTAFRLANQIVDVQADIQGQMGLLNTLQAQQAEALIELDLLSDSVREGDPRLDQAQRRLAVIDVRIEEERRKFGIGGSGPGGADYATIVSEFERLTVDREYAETAYATALSSFDGSKAEANRQSRYLAAYVAPTRAERAEFPQRILILGTVALFSFLIWIVFSLIYYSLRERR